MNLGPFLMSFVAAAAAVLASPGGASHAPADEPLACRLEALSPARRVRHQKLTGLLQHAVVGARELPDGWELALDLSRLPADAQGGPVCVVEIAEWVDLEARCCPFLDFGVHVRGRSTGSLALALTGGPGVKEFLGVEFSLIEKKLESGP